MRTKRVYIPDSIVFITQITHERRAIFSDDVALELLRATLRNVKALHPFEMVG